jgi:hypothetical protein
VQRPAGPAFGDHTQAGPLEQVLRALVGQPAPPGDRADVDGRRRARRDRATIREEEWAGAAAVDQARQEPSGSCLPIHVLDRAALGADPGPRRPTAPLSSRCIPSGLVRAVAASRPGPTRD